jgi:hypothetical protein
MCLQKVKCLQSVITQTRICQGSVIPHKHHLRDSKQILYFHSVLPTVKILSLLEIQTNQESCLAQFHKVDIL